MLRKKTPKKKVTKNKLRSKRLAKKKKMIRANNKRRKA